MNDPLVLLIHARSKNTIWSEREQTIIDHLAVRYSNLQFVGLPFLYDRDPEEKEVHWIREQESPLLVLSFLSDRAVYALLDYFQIPGQRVSLSAERSDSFPLRPIFCSELSVFSEESIVPVLDQFFKFIKGRSEPGSVEKNRSPLLIELPNDQEEKWYPLLDRDRCIGCLECVNFCLFGVYSIDADDRPIVLHPEECRNGCPACSRVCPEGAIIFPLYDDPMISGRTTSSKSETSLRDLIPDTLEEEEKRSIEKHLSSLENKKTDLSSEMDRLINQTEDLIH